MIADTLLRAGVATSRYGARLFRPLTPPDASCNTVTNTKSDGHTITAPSSTQDGSSVLPDTVAFIRDDSQQSIAAVEASLAAQEAREVGVDGEDAATAAAVLEQLSAAADVYASVGGKDKVEADSSYHLGETGAAIVMQESHTDAE